MRASFKDVNLHDARVTGQIAMVGASFDGTQATATPPTRYAISAACVAFLENADDPSALQNCPSASGYEPVDRRVIDSDVVYHRIAQPRIHHRCGCDHIFYRVPHEGGDHDDNQRRHQRD